MACPPRDVSVCPIAARNVLNNLVHAFQSDDSCHTARTIHPVGIFVIQQRTIPSNDQNPLTYSLLPESPRWLMMKGRNAEALATLARLHAHGNQNDIFVQAEFEDIRYGVEKEQLETRDAWVQLFTNKANFRRVVSLLILPI